MIRDQIGLIDLKTPNRMSVRLSMSPCFLNFHINFGYARLHLRKSRYAWRRVICSINDRVKENVEKDGKYLEREMAAARREKRPFRIDKSKMTPVELQKLRLRSKAIPMVVDHDPIDVLHEDDTFLVVCKPSFIKMHPSHRFQGGSLLNRTIGYLGYAPCLLHRLDMHTTGVVVFAKKKDVCAPIMAQFRNGQVQKDYICVVDGNRDDMHVDTTFVVDAPIQRNSEAAFVREVGNTKDGWKDAITSFQVVAKSPSVNESQMMVLQATPKTGRTHQIRVHARHAGFPIVGDDLYNPKE